MNDRRKALSSIKYKFYNYRLEKTNKQIEEENEEYMVTEFDKQMRKENLKTAYEKQKEEVDDLVSHQEYVYSKAIEKLSSLVRNYVARSNGYIGEFIFNKSIGYIDFVYPSLYENVFNEINPTKLYDIWIDSCYGANDHSEDERISREIEESRREVEESSGCIEYLEEEDRPIALDIMFPKSYNSINKKVDQFLEYEVDIQFYKAVKEICFFNKISSKRSLEIGLFIHDLIIDRNLPMDESKFSEREKIASRKINRILKQKES